MPATIRELMTPIPVTLPPEGSITDAARMMRDEGIGDVLVVEGDRLVGLVTDRDIVVRCLAEGADIREATIREACSDDIVTLAPDASVDEAVQIMRDHAVRRVPVVEDSRPIGIVSIGDLAIEEDPTSALADISAAPDDK